MISQVICAEIQVFTKDLGFVEAALYRYRQAQNINAEIEIFSNDKLRKSEQS